MKFWIFIIIIFCGVFFGAKTFMQEKNTHVPFSQTKETDDTKATSAPSDNTPQIGGHFTLTDQKGHVVKDTDLHGKYSLLFFGFTHCPDICPTTLHMLTEVMNNLGDKRNDVQPVFITVDPERDNVEQMAHFLSSYHPSILGLTGSEEAIKDTIKAFKVYASKTDEEPVHLNMDAKEVEKTGAVPEKKHDCNCNKKNYTMNHSSFIYLMDKDGQYLTHFSFGTSAETIVAALKEKI